MKTNDSNNANQKRNGPSRRSSLEIPEPALKTSHFTIGNSSNGISNVQIGRPKRTSQLLASAMIKMEVDESNQKTKRNQNRKRFPENDDFIQKCIFVKQT